MRNPSLSPCGALALLLALAPVAAHAQSGASAAGSAQSSQQSSAQPAAASAAPASAPAAASAQTQAAPIPNAKPAKVWTNEEIGALHDGVSIVGKNGPQNAGSTSAKPKGYSMEKDPNWYRKQLQPLQAEIDQLNVQIEKTKAFLSGDHVNDASTGTVRAYYSPAGNPQEQLQKLEARRDKDVAKVNDLLDRARHNDIPPGALR